MMKPSFLLSCIIAGLFALTSLQAAELDPKADKVLQQTSDTLKAAKRFSVDFSSVMKVEATGMKQEMTSAYAVAVERPARMALRHREGMLGGTIVSDGETLISYAAMFGNYFETDAPATLGGIPEATEVWSLVSGASMGGFDLLSSVINDDPYAAITDDITTLRYIGEDTVGGQAAHHLRAEQDEFDWDLWVSKGEQALPLKIVPDFAGMKEELAGQMPGMEDLSMSLTVTFTDWKIDPTLPKDAFEFTPPEGAEKADSLMDAIGGMAMEEEEESQLVGETAPAFELNLLDGGKLQLADHKDRQIVLLDFWATWCGPCVRALPELAGIAADYKDKGLVFYAVNQQEDKKTIQAFLDKQKLDIQVALDPKGNVGDLYGVSGIPQTVLIGKDGRVADVHVGFMPGLRKILSEKIDALLDN